MRLLYRKIRLWPFVLVLLLVAAGGAYAFVDRHPYAEPVAYDFPLTAGTSSASQPPDSATEGAKEPALPPSVRIQVPFMSQAPHGNWDMPYQEACEEASLILVHHYLQGKPIDPDQMDREILEMVRFEEEELGFGADITMAELAEVARKMYGHDAELFEDFTTDDMKRFLAQGHPIIVPLAGRRLGNPYYSGEGPWYHALVITGYDEKHFITNDVGTRRGERYKFPYDTIYRNIHDWNTVKEDIERGKRVMLVVRRK